MTKNRNKLTIIIVLIIFFQYFSGENAIAQKVAQFSFDGPSGSMQTIDSITQASFSISNHFNHAERIQGIKGNALRLDGWSTWASSYSYQLKGISNTMTVSAWYATETFTKDNSAIISQIDNSSGFDLEVGPFGNVFFNFYADNTLYTLETFNKLTCYTWNYIVATIDLPNKIAQIYVNGKLWASKQLSPQSKISLSTTTMYLGKGNDNPEFAGFPLNALNGAMDEVYVYKNIPTQAEIESNYQKYDSITPDLTLNPDSLYVGDYLRPRYHAMPNADWTNEPYGLTYYKGKYHIFFQKNPNGPYLYFMHWGHLSSPDLVNWTEDKIALAPSPGFDSFGIWSGSTVKDSTGRPTIYYTGVNGVKAGIGMATSKEDSLIHWTKYYGNPLIPSPPAGYASMDFRDPFVWKSGKTYYMIVGSGLQNNGGGILFTYKSTDMTHWTNIPPLYQETNTSIAGTFWEMPFFFHLKDSTYILGTTPVPTSTKPAETIYWTGTWDGGQFKPFNRIPNKLELINGKLLSPAFGLDADNRITYIGIIPEDRDVADQIKAGWRHTFSLPRVVRLLNDSLIGQYPHPNLCRLRYDQVSIKNRVLSPGTGHNLPEISGNQIEMKFKIKADPNSKFTIQVFKNAAATEFTSLVFDLANDQAGYDRSHSSLSSGTPKDSYMSHYVFNPNDTIRINIFLDHSIVEVFLDNLTVFSFRVYPSSIESQNVDFIVNSGKVNIVDLEKWKMKDMRAVNSQEMCEPSYIPDSFFKSGTTTGIKEYHQNNNGFILAPNPANSRVKIAFKKPEQGPVGVEIWDIYGKKLISKTFSLGSIVKSDMGLDISSLSSGIYIARVKSKNNIGSSILLVSR